MLYHRFRSGTVFGVGIDGTGSTDGTLPYAGVYQANDGNLYGTTQSGGKFGAGLIFKIALNGSSYQVLHSFGN